MDTWRPARFAQVVKLYCHGTVGTTKFVLYDVICPLFRVSFKRSYTVNQCIDMRCIPYQ